MEQLVGEIQIFVGPYAPDGWAFCNGQTLPINGNEVLYSIIGTTYGGDGVNNFALPNLMGRVPIGTGTSSTGNNYVIGQAVGTPEVTLGVNNIPAHTHAVTAKLKVSAATADKLTPVNNYWAVTGATDPEYAPTADKFMNAQGVDIALAPAGGTATPVNNMQPFVAINYIIAIQGLYPQRP